MTNSDPRLRRLLIVANIKASDPTFDFEKLKDFAHNGGNSSFEDWRKDMLVRVQKKDMKEIVPDSARKARLKNIAAEPGNNIEHALKYLKSNSKMSFKNYAMLQKAKLPVVIGAGAIGAGLLAKKLLRKPTLAERILKHKVPVIMSATSAAGLGTAAYLAD